MVAQLRPLWLQLFTFMVVLYIYIYDRLMDGFDHGSPAVHWMFPFAFVMPGELDPRMTSPDRS